MRSNEIRRAFLDFFRDKGHQIVPSAPLVIKNDPTLMFTNAGMNQFKDYFLGNRQAPYKRVADTQKCLRVSGKHNDLEEVGIDTYHHTMFEMLGNWSFGNYFKKEALEWSWELLTQVYKLPADRLYVTVFGGDEKENLASDQEAKEIWKTMVPESQILYGNKKDNFWEMGETGPCGPCSEIHIDLRDEAEIAQSSGRNWVNSDHPQVIEIWNNVFMEFNRLSDGSLQKLPEQHVDTGMGFERLCMAIQGKRSSYDTDVFQPTIEKIAEKSGFAYGDSNKTDIAMRVIADHIRAISFTIADGQLPSNNKAGYVIRRILRRAVRYYYNFLSIREPFLHTLIPGLAQQFEEVFPELQLQVAFVSRVIFEEEASFLRTLSNGLSRLENVLSDLNLTQRDTIPGQTAFELFDTFGFPLDLTALIARENGFSIDEAGFNAEMQAQKARSRQAGSVEASDWVYLTDDEDVLFTGYDATESETIITRYRKVTAKGKTQFHLVLAETPFYAESGGQVGDTGEIVPENQAFPPIRVVDTRKENDLILHISEQDGLEKYLAGFTGKVFAKIDNSRRNRISNNHSATHLLHSGLRKVLGTHVAQKGSLVNPDWLRFDFSHFAKLSDAELAEVEAIVNTKIRENIKLQEQRHTPIEEAKALGAMALFGEKYGDFVRVITFDPNWSVELCGGTHVPATGQIGLLKIVSESSVAAGVRRVEAITADRAESYLNQQLAQLEALKGLLKNPFDPVKTLESILEEKAKLAKEVEKSQAESLQLIKKELLQNIEALGGVNFIAAKLVLPNAEAEKQLAFELRAQVENLVLVLAVEVEAKPHLTVMLSDSVIANQGLNAVKMVKDLAVSIKGGGGGQPFYATAGGKDLGGLAIIIEKAKDLMSNLV